METIQREALQKLSELTAELSELSRQYQIASARLSALIEQVLSVPVSEPDPPTTEPELPTLPPGVDSPGVDSPGVDSPGVDSPVVKVPADPYGPVTAYVGEDFSFTIPTNGKDADISDLPPGLSFNRPTLTISGKPTQPDQRTLKISLSDGAKKFLQLSVIIRGIDPPGVDLLPIPPATTNPPQTPSVPVSAPLLTTYLSESPKKATFSDKPFGYNRLQVIHPPYEDGWVLKGSEIAVENAPGFPNETPELLEMSGQNMKETLWYYGSSEPSPFGLPMKTDNLFFEVTGACWEPYRTCFDVLNTDLKTIGESLTRALPAWNTVPENGLIDGVPTVKECHFNLEYAFFLADGDGDYRNHWNKWTDSMRNSRYLNYANNRVETFQETYNRGGIAEIDNALHQKWRNIIGLSILIINRTSKMRAYYGDHSGIAEQHHVVDWYRDYPISDLFRSDVNDGSRFGEANNYCNAGQLTINGQPYNLSGNLREMAGISHNYNYESYFDMSQPDFNEFYNLRGSGHNINDWYDKMKPDLWRPYNFALHAQLTDYVRKKKGWDGYKVYWQTEPIYENSIRVVDKSNNTLFTQGAWVPWTLDAQAPFRPCKIPLHPEVCNAIVYNARMNLQGLFIWGGWRRQYLEQGRSENSHPELHQKGREGLQIALDNINQHPVFGPDTQKLLGNIPIWNEAKREWFAGDASQLVQRNGKQPNGQPTLPIPLVTGVYRPSNNTELYQVYFPHAGRYDQSEVKFKSPIDGKELTAIARGWGPTLYSRKTA